jgi:hypothetical protein
LIPAQLFCLSTIIDPNQLERISAKVKHFFAQLSINSALKARGTASAWNSCPAAATSHSIGLACSIEEVGQHPGNEPLALNPQLSASKLES